jgi:ion channel-forming bestrophin family protein
MIPYNNKTWFGHILSFHKTDTLRRLWQELLIVAVLVGVFVYVELNYLDHDKAAYESVGKFQALTTLAFSLLLVFRINSAYDRWWEGRKLWGSFVNNTRNLAVKINAYVDKSDVETRGFFKRMIPNFVYASKEHLRSGVKFEELELLENESDIKSFKHVPNGIINAMYKKVSDLNKSGKLSEEKLIVLDNDLKTFLDNLGGCERIKKTPIPFSYSIFLKKFIVLFVTSAPFSFVHIAGYWTIPVSMVIFYFFVSLELISEEIEDPFGTDSNDLPTDDICATIKQNVIEILEQ